LIVAGSNGAPRTLLPNDYHDFGPRLGFAYQLTGDGKTVVRGGYGLFYSSIVAASAISLHKIRRSVAKAHSASSTVSASHFLAPLPRVQPPARARTKPCRQPALYRFPLPALISAPPTNISPIAWLPSNRVPQVSQYNLQVQRQLGTNQSLSLAYVGTYGSRLTRNYNANQQLFNLDPNDPTSRLFANLGSVTVSDNRGNPFTTLCKRSTNVASTDGLQFLGAFTWSKTIDDSAARSTPAPPSFTTNYNIERGLSEIDQPYRMSLSALYELPFGRGRRWGSNWSRPIDWAIGGWQLQRHLHLVGRHAIQRHRERHTRFHTR